MTFKSIVVCTLIAFGELSTLLPSFGQGDLISGTEMGTSYRATRPEAITFMKEVQKEVRTSVKKTVPGCSISGYVKSHEYPRDIKLVGPSSSAQFDADCIEALLDKQRRDSSDMTLSGFWLFPSELTSDCPNKAAAGKVLIFNIPPSVLTKYPGKFDSVEIFNRKNYSALHTTSANGKLTEAQIAEINAHYQQWHAFLEHHPNATKVQISEAMCSGVTS
jgi:hypothetical protein